MIFLKVNLNNFLAEVLNFTWLKYMIGIIVAGLSPLFIGGNKELFIALIIFIFIDTLTGWLNANKNNRVNSGEFGRIITKIISYSLAFFMVGYVEILILGESSYLSNMLLMIMMFTEFLSIMENLKLLGVPIPNFIVNEILKKIKYKPIQELLSISEKKIKLLKEFDSIQELSIRIQDVNKAKIANTMISVFKNSAQTIVDSNFYDGDISGNKLKLFTILEVSNRQVLDTLSKQAIPNDMFQSFVKSNAERLEELRDDLGRIIDKDIDGELKNVVLKEIGLCLYDAINCISKL